MLPNFAALDKEPDVLVVKRAIEILTQVLTGQSTRCCDIIQILKRVRYSTIRYNIM